MYMSRVNIDEINYFYTSVKKFPVTIKEPDEEVITSWNHPAYLYIQEYVECVQPLPAGYSS